MNTRYLYFFPLLALISFQPILGEDVETFPLDFETAWQRVLQSSPMLQIANEETAIWQAEQRQATLYPNPLFVLEVDHDMTYAVSQIIEPAGKRVQRYRVASKGKSIAEWTVEILCRDLRQEVSLAFLHIALMQEKMKIVDERRLLSEKILQSSNSKVAIGKKDSLHACKAQIAHRSSQLACTKLQANFDKIKKGLCMKWGKVEPDFKSVSYPLFSLPSPPPREYLEGLLKENPRYLKETDGVHLALESLHLQREERVPNVEVTAAYSLDDGFCFDFAIPLPIFNRNQENICKANHRLNQAQLAQTKVYQELRAEFLETYQHFSTAYQHAKMVETEMLNEALQTMELTEEGYQKCKIGFGDWMEMKNTIFALREEYLEYLRDYHEAKIRLETLIGTNFLCTHQPY